MFYCYSSQRAHLLYSNLAPGLEFTEESKYFRTSVKALEEHVVVFDHAKRFSSGLKLNEMNIIIFYRTSYRTTHLRNASIY